MGTRLKDKIAIVCGAGSSSGGLSNGMAAAVVYAREGAKVFAVDLEIDRMQGTQQSIEAEGGVCKLHRSDVSVASDVQDMIASCTATFGDRIDILHNNVGIPAIGGPIELVEEEFDRVMRVNVKSMFLTCKAVLPAMSRQACGSIINVSSLAGIRFAYPSFAYAASKGAVNQLSQNIAGQYAAQGIRCNVVMPGYIAAAGSIVRMRKQFGDAFEEKFSARARRVPSGRLGEPWDVAYAALFLASDESKYITGTSIVVDGGLSCAVTGTVSENFFA
jgi:NAD(P)-dependent dehydrogenase (short-subunit alcohol dehydrogenase family)